MTTPAPARRRALLARALAGILGLLPGTLVAEEAEGFVPLFNGRDLSGWVNANCAPETWSVRDGVIFCTGRPTGALRTARQYENFILELEWRHLSSGGNSGVFLWGTPIAAPGVPFLRGIEVQVLDHGFNVSGKNEWYTTHGDVFPIHGATMKPFGRHNGDRSFPSEERSKPSPEWNHYRIVATNGVIRLSVNGKEVSGGEDCNYRQGYLALESEGAPVEFRNVRLEELPSNHPAAGLVAPSDLGWRPLFTGLDFRGWRTNAATATRWRVAGERLAVLGGAPEAASTLWTTAEFGNAELVIDWRAAKPGAVVSPEGSAAPVVLWRGPEAGAAPLRLVHTSPGNSQRFVISVTGRQATVTRDGQELQRVTLPADAPLRGPLGLQAPGSAGDFMNLYVREL
jgi:hypothetical protein